MRNDLRVVADVVGRRCADNILIHVDGSGTNLCQSGCPLTAAICSGQPHEAELFLHHRLGHRVPVAVRVAPLHHDDGRVEGAIELFAPLATESAVQARLAELERLSLLDDLTRLPNRRHIRAELRACAATRRGGGLPFGALFIDIDRFKPFNDDHGHAAGDLALQTVARTLHGAMRPFDVIGRWGGDEFVGLFPNVTTTTLTAIAGRLTMLVRTSRMNTTDGPLAVSVSIGGAVSRPADAADSLLRRADVALYASKKAGRGRCSVDGGEAAET